MRKARIEFGPGGLVFFVVAALILAAAIYTQANLLFWSFGLMVGGVAVSLLLILLLMRGVRVQRLVPEHGVVGEAMLIRYKVVNAKRWLPTFNLVIHETWGTRHFEPRGWEKTGPLAEMPQRLTGRPHAWLLHLGPGQTQQAEAPCWPHRRGVLQFQRLVISSAFPFGLVRRVIECEQVDQVIVYPALYRLHRGLISRMARAELSGQIKHQRAGGTDEFFGLRPYRAGDSQRLIDWKHSARTGALISREMAQSSPPKITLLLDLSRKSAGRDGGAGGAASFVGGDGNGRGEAEARKSWWPFSSGDDAKTAAELDEEALAERAISLAASVICDAHLRGYEVGLAVRGVPCGMFHVHHSLPHRTRMLEALAMLDLSQRSDRPLSMSLQPTVLVHSLVEGQPAPRPQCVALAAKQMDQYVGPIKGGAVAMLNRRPRPVSRAGALAEAAT